MHTKKMIYCAMAFALAAALLVSTGFACGRHHGGNRQRVSPAVYLCPVEDCEEYGRHIHDGVTYCGYDHSGGVCNGQCAALCSVEDCQIAGRHTHDDAICCGYDHESGFCDGTCAALCTVENCEIIGRHTHSGTVYCGYAHGGCFCDGTCANAAPVASRGFRQHHGGHC
ncbi:hypothetical protein D1646_13375 [Pseudoflavonifractor sp. 60]|uniref:hypothetical protein n=1 Tax=Pseudoflavonifractor sp. 60 TaxID=2304576 RepID=UPI00136FA9FD|nr:hypothetical protein [Pseudoflavonifractor sp. 60]NBI67775.1 hypothetical protein [Pseudoflavonifractor sp. 60]